MIGPITLGNRQFASNLMQAPLAGVSSAPFRELIWQFGGPAYCTTEMISAKTLLHNPPKRYVHRGPKEGPLCFQLSGNQPDLMVAAARHAIENGADLIDLNCGCPVDKIRKKGCGSKLLSQTETLYQVVKALRESVSVPVSVKVRVDGQSGDRFNTDVVKAIEDAGADFIIVHGRHWSEHYETAARLDEIASIVQIARIPVIGNGDVSNYASLQKMMVTTGCAGVMIGRASVGRPWLFQKLQAEERGEGYIIPVQAAIGQLLFRHISHLSLLENEVLAVLQARKLSKYYLRAAELDLKWHEQFIAIRHLDELKTLIDQIFGINLYAGSLSEPSSKVC